MVVGSSATPVEWRGVSVKVARRPPPFRNGRSSRRHRHLGRPAGDERGKDHTNRSSDPIADAAREHEPGGPPDGLGSGRDAGVGRIEAETVRALDRARFLAHPAGQIQEFPDANVSSESASQAPPGLRGQRRGYEKASPLKVEGRIHTQDVLARTWRVAHSPADHSNETVCTSLHTERGRT
jgi:hypothetical protein